MYTYSENTEFLTFSIPKDFFVLWSQCEILLLLGKNTLFSFSVFTNVQIRFVNPSALSVKFRIHRGNGKRCLPLGLSHQQSSALSSSNTTPCWFAFYFK